MSTGRNSKNKVPAGIVATFKGGTRILQPKAEKGSCSEGTTVLVTLYTANTQDRRETQEFKNTQTYQPYNI